MQVEPFLKKTEVLFFSYFLLKLRLKSFYLENLYGLATGAIEADIL